MYQAGTGVEGGSDNLRWWLSPGSLYNRVEAGQEGGKRGREGRAPVVKIQTFPSTAAAWDGRLQNLALDILDLVGGDAG